MKIARYIPKGSSVIRPKGVDAVVYFRAWNGESVQGIAYAGKAINPTWNYRFRSVARMHEYVGQWAEGLKAKAAAKADRKAKRAAFVHALKLGDVLSTCWGYEQTNREYFEVTKVLDKCVEVREIAQVRKETGWLQGKCAPVPGEYIGPVIRKKVLPGNMLKMSKWGRIASLVEPKMICGAKVYGADHWTAYA